MAITARVVEWARVTARRPTIQRIDDPDEEGPDVRLAEQRDVPRIAATLTVALADSRWTRWALPDDGRMQRLTRLHELDAGAPRASPRGTRLGHRRRRRRRRVGAARRRGRHRSPAGRRAARPWPASCPTSRRTAWPPSATPPRWSPRPGPTEPHWWLAHLGVRPTSRRRGLAAAVLAPVLVRCDAEGTLAAAAVFSWANVRFLRGFGFEVTARPAGRRTTSCRCGCWCGSLCAR